MLTDALVSTLGYAVDAGLVFCKAGSTTDVALVPTSAGTVYSSAVVMPPRTNGRSAVQLVVKTAITPSTMPLEVYACVGNTPTPTTDIGQLIQRIPAGTAWTAGSTMQWIVPEQYSGYKYIRLCFKQAATGTVTAGEVHAFMHGLG